MAMLATLSSTTAAGVVPKPERKYQLHPIDTAIIAHAAGTPSQSEIARIDHAPQCGSSDRMSREAAKETWLRDLGHFDPAANSLNMHAKNEARRVEIAYDFSLGLG
jgi:hypothetical protein